jgi:hypothetical protein
MLRGSAWTAHFDSMEEAQQRLVEWEDKRARRRAEFAARMPLMAAPVVAEVKAEVTAAVSAAVTGALHATLAGHH